jgi:hypothetical protein
MSQFTSKDNLLYVSLINFYSTKINLDILLPIINQTSNISLRILDWLVTNYSKKHNVYYEIFKNGNRQIFSIYLSYKNQLKAYSKKYFDPFCRRDRINIDLYQLNNDMTGIISTTIGQLNFFRWFIENKLLNYVVLNINNIDKDMNDTLSIIKDKKKRKELSSNTIKNVNVINETFLISFD